MKAICDGGRLGQPFQLGEETKARAEAHLYIVCSLVGSVTGQHGQHGFGQLLQAPGLPLPLYLSRATIRKMFDDPRRPPLLSSFAIVAAGPSSITRHARVLLLAVLLSPPFARAEWVRRRSDNVSRVHVDEGVDRGRRGSRVAGLGVRSVGSESGPDGRTELVEGDGEGLTGGRVEEVVGAVSAILTEHGGGVALFGTLDGERER